MSEPKFPKPFVAQRDEDVSGISGEGVVAEGVQFSDGWVVTHWLDQPPMNEPKTDVWHNKGAQPFERVHGHGGATRIIWADEVAAARQELLADIAEAYDVPAWMVGGEAERVYLRRQIVGALRQQLVRSGRTPDEDEARGIDELADAVMPIVDQCLSQRERWKTTVSRAFALAYRWQGAHGASMFLVRAAGTELAEALDGDPDITLAGRENGDGVPATEPGDPYPSGQLACDDVAELERLRAEIARLREGEEPYTDEGVVPTPAQWIWRWNRATSKRRLERAAQIMEMGEQAFACSMADHQGALEELRNAAATLARVMEVVDVWIADRARASQDGEGTEIRHIAKLKADFLEAAGRTVAPVLTCGEHDGVCFPQSGARCVAHGDEQCALCHRNPANCARGGNCGTWSVSGMHWDTCANRVRGPLARQEV